MYLETFCLPSREIEERILSDKAAKNGGAFGFIDNPYPCGMFSSWEQKCIKFKRITIFYGGNGSGKSTLLNIISERLRLRRIAPFSSGEMFELYVKKCRFESGYDDDGNEYEIPEGSRVISSDDIFDYMLTVRANNDEIDGNTDLVRYEHGKMKFGETVTLRDMNDYEALRLQVLTRSKSVSRRKFVKKVLGEETKLNSNGETALRYFEQMLDNDCLYCLDEPENSMSPKMQIKLVKMLEEMARYCGCQFVIATHSPFILAMTDALIYDLDANPVDVKNWWELENTKIYFDFFSKHRKLFEK